jgi:hypothetical protein
LDLTNKGTISKESFKQVRGLKDKGIISDAEYNNMIETGKIVTKNTAELYWDALLSREAKSAMIQAALMETGISLLSAGTSGISEDLLADFTNRKAVFDSIRLERNAATNKLLDIRTMNNPTKEILDQIQGLNRIIAHANKQLGLLFHVDSAVPKLGSFLVEQYPYEEAKK